MSIRITIKYALYSIMYYKIIVACATATCNVKLIACGLCLCLCLCFKGCRGKKIRTLTWVSGWVGSIKMHIFCGAYFNTNTPLRPCEHRMLPLPSGRALSLSLPLSLLFLPPPPPASTVFLGRSRCAGRREEEEGSEEGGRGGWASACENKKTDAKKY
jgi:hypothetical protein